VFLAQCLRDLRHQRIDVLVVGRLNVDPRYRVVTGDRTGTLQPLLGRCQGDEDHVILVAKGRSTVSFHNADYAERHIAQANSLADRQHTRREQVAHSCLADHRHTRPGQHITLIKETAEGNRPVERRHVGRRRRPDAPPRLKVSIRCRAGQAQLRDHRYRVRYAKRIGERVHVFFSQRRA